MIDSKIIKKNKISLPNVSRETLTELEEYSQLILSKNRKINLIEYYDLIYEYKNDCLTAGIKYRKTYYEDRELKPSEDLLFTISFYPLTSYEQKIDDNLFN